MDVLHLTQELRGQTVLVTAGPTREPIDPVRYIGNRSSERWDTPWLKPRGTWVRM